MTRRLSSSAETPELTDSGWHPGEAETRAPEAGTPVPPGAGTKASHLQRRAVWTLRTLPSPARQVNVNSEQTKSREAGSLPGARGPGQAAMTSVNCNGLGLARMPWGDAVRWGLLGAIFLSED